MAHRAVRGVSTAAAATHVQQHHAGARPQDPIRTDRCERPEAMEDELLRTRRTTRNKDPCRARRLEAMRDAFIEKVPMLRRLLAPTDFRQPVGIGIDDRNCVAMRSRNR